MLLDLSNLRTISSTLRDTCYYLSKKLLKLNFQLINRFSKFCFCTWGHIGIDIDITKNIIKITYDRVSSIFNTIEFLTEMIFTSARKLSKLAGKIFSTKFTIDDITNRKTRFIYRSMENRSSWDSTFDLAYQIETLKKILLWKNNIKKPNKRVINDYYILSITVYSDVSSPGLDFI